MFKDIAQLNPLFRDQITNFSINQVASNVFDEPDKLADFAAAVSTGDVQELQDVQGIVSSALGALAGVCGLDNFFIDTIKEEVGRRENKSELL